MNVAKAGRAPRLPLTLDTYTRSRIDQFAKWCGEPAATTAASFLTAVIVSLELEAKRIAFTEAEAGVLCEVIQNDFTLNTGFLGPRILANLADAFYLARQQGGGLSSYAEQFGIDEDVLLEKLRGLGPLPDLALRITIAKWWDLQSAYDETDDGEQISDREAYLAAGFTIIDATGSEK